VAGQTEVAAMATFGTKVQVAACVADRAVA